MRSVAYCCAEYAEATQRAAGVVPRLSPPVISSTLPRGWFDGYDFVYFDLHGKPGAPAWYNNADQVALTADYLARSDLRGAVVFAVNCYLGDVDSPMLEALLQAGAVYVIGGAGPNYAGRRAPAWAAALGRWVRVGLSLGLTPPRALGWAKRLVKHGAGRDHKTELVDTLQFKAFYKGSR